MENNKNYTLVPHVIDPEIEQYWVDIKNNFDESNVIISDFIKSWSEENSVSSEDFCRKVDMTKKEYKKIMNNDSNLSILEVVEIARATGHKLHITFQKIDK